MRGTKFFQIYGQLSLKDIGRFDKFIRSPYFNVNDTHIILSELYYAMYREESLDYTKAEAWERIFPGQPYKDEKFRKIISDLLKLLQNFFVIEEVEQKRILKAQMLIQSVNKRKLKKLINSSIEEASQSVKKSVNRNSELYLFNYQIQKNAFYLREGDFDITNKDIEIISENLDKFYIAEKLKYYCDILGREYLSNVSFKFGLIEEIFRHIEEHKLQEDLIIGIYYRIAKMLMSSGVSEDYFILKKTIIDNYLHFEGVELQELFGALLNYCIRQINLGNHTFNDEMIEIYDFIFRKNIILNENYITPSKFLNIVTISLRNGRYDFAEIFIQEYGYLIPESQRDGIVAFSLAQIAFYQKNYNKVITNLQRVDNSDLIVSLRARALLLATYYESGQTEAFLNLNESTRIFLKRMNKKLSRNITEMYKNFIVISRRICLLAGNEDTSVILNRLDALTNKIISEQWLREKLAEKSKR